jgi:hypothetical protein
MMEIRSGIFERRLIRGRACQAVGNKQTEDSESSERVEPAQERCSKVFRCQSQIVCRRRQKVSKSVHPRTEAIFLLLSRPMIYHQD